jgi:ABC-2 type transport system ATP-binding protein
LNPPGGGAAVAVRDLRKSYGSVEAVRGISFEIGTGECFGLLGPNGAGKTTTVEVLEGLLPATAGEVAVLGRRWGEDDHEIRERLGVCLQQTVLPEKLEVGETVSLFRALYREGRDPGEVVGEVGLQEKTRARVGTLSGGQKQRLAVACALVGDPELLFLDEPTTGLDPQSRRQVWDIVKGFKERGRTVVLTTHYMDEAEALCDHVAIMDHGRIIALGTPRELVASLGAEHLVEVVPGPSATPVDVAALGRIEGVRDARVTDGRIELRVAELHRSVPAILEALARAGVTLAELRTHSASLEDVFVGLTGRHLRDE